ncbi:unnamed protein product [Fraxinus pennsylvanica]|uniref:Uncharacterized protein n=1 Tax=Fraxinus pennsylvanica TaxID=56036 RepID=A0AAD1YQN8_9LAMI|nr:unnamed protein product [Fraxinus pennsylvanica]
MAHVSSIAAGNYVEDVSFFGYAPGTARGVAPRTRLAAYKVLSDEGSYASDALAGIDHVVADAAFGAMEKGILVSVSAGNQGPNFSTLLEGIPWAVIVASGTVDRWNLPLAYNKTLSACNSKLLAEALRSIIICVQSDQTAEFNDRKSYISASNVPTAIIISEDTRILRFTDFPHLGVVISPKDADKSLAAIRSAMMTTASTVDNTRKPNKDVGHDYDIAPPLDMEAGQVDLNRALDPGIIYDATAQDYVNLICALNFTREQTQTIIRPSYNCSNPSLDLNYHHL